MLKHWWKYLLVSTAVFGVSLVVSAGAIASEMPLTPEALKSQTEKDATADAGVLEEVLRYSDNGSTEEVLGQVTNVSQLGDVSPGDWAYEALLSLVERYGCIAGSPDGTFQGNRALTRYEFAAGLNACLDRVNELIRAATSDSVRREDLTTLQRLQAEFSAELATVRGRVDALEATTAQLEANQFSTTTGLNGEVVLGLAGIVSGENIFGEDVDDVTIFGSRTRLNSETSFTGRDLLRTRLQAFGLDTFTSRTQTFEGNLAFAVDDPNFDANNDVEIEELTYSFPIGTSTQVVLAANGADADNFASTVNFLDGDGGFGALSRFGTRNPIYYLVRGSGIGITQQLGNALELSLGYLASDAGNPDNDSGLFNGPYGALAQLVFKPSDRFQIGFTYINSYNRETLTGSPLSNPRTFLSNLSNLPVNVNFQPPAIPGTPRFFPANQPIPAGEVLPAGTQLPAGTTLNITTTLPFPVTLPAPATPGTPRVFPANQPIPAGETLPAGTQLPAGTTLNAAIALPFPVTLPAPILGTITAPAGTTIPAGTALPTPVTLPINLTLPAPITLPVNLTIPAAVPPPLGIITTTPSETTIPAGTALPTPVTLPIDIALPAPITLPVDLTIPAAAVPPPQPLVFNGTVGEFLSQPDFAGIPLGFDLDIPIISNSYGIELSWQLSDKFVLGGWVGYTSTTTLSTGNGLFSRADINTINGAVTLAFPDLGKKGNLGGIIVGVEPFVLDTDIEVNQNFVDPATLNTLLIPAGLALFNSVPAITQVLNSFDEADPDVSLHVEAFYQLQLTDNISLTPGVIWITAPGSLSNNADLVIGTIRTTFRF